MPGKVTEPLVIDGSAATNAVLVDDPFSGWPEFQLHAPTLMWSEVASALSQMRWRGDLTASQARDAVKRLVELPIKATESQDLVVDAYELARELSWAKSYDAEYVVLARRLEAPLLTADARLAARVNDLVRVLSPAEASQAKG